MKACIENHFGAFEICCAHRVFGFFFNKLQLFVIKHSCVKIINVFFFFRFLK